MRIATTLVFVIVLMVVATNAFAQAPSPKPENFLAIDSAFTSGQYDQVELLVLRRLQSDTTLTPDETARLCLLAAYSLIMLDRESDARNYFSRALDAVPDLKLDPVQVSPKFRMVFDDVAAHHVAKKNAPIEPVPTSANQKNSADLPLISTRTISPQSQLLNLALPGIGQIREGHAVRGAVILTAQAATVGVFLWRLNELRLSRAQYLAETDNARIHTTYNTYNRDYHWAWGTGAAVAVVYLAAQADLIRLSVRSGGGRAQAEVFPGSVGAPLALSAKISW